jgi:hypothetical protein
VKKNNKINKKKMQFSKKVAVFSLFLVFYSVNLSAILSAFGKEPLSDITIAVIGTFGGFAVGGYYALSGARDCSLNKNHVELDKGESEQIDG